MRPARPGPTTESTRARTRLARSPPGPSRYDKPRTSACFAAALIHRTGIRLAAVCSTLDALLLERWAEAATASLERHRVEIDRINVFPVPDGDTGTNMLLTMRSATAAVPLATTAAARTLAAAASHTGTSPAAAPHGAAAEAVASALARGALLGARGNSGVILSQMLRGVAEAVASADGLGGGRTLTDALVRGARLAAASVVRPLDGTMLTVLAAAAAAADRLGKDRRARQGSARHPGRRGRRRGRRRRPFRAPRHDRAAARAGESGGRRRRWARPLPRSGRARGPGDRPRARGGAPVGAGEASRSPGSESIDDEQGLRGDLPARGRERREGCGAARCAGRGRGRGGRGR